MKKYYLILALCCYFAFADAEIEGNDNKYQEADNIIKSASEGRDVVLEKKQEYKQEENSDNKIFYKETILNWHYSLQKQNKRAGEFVGKTGENLLVKNVTTTDNNNNGNVSNTDKAFVTIKGYCFIRDEINVGKQPSALRTECQTNYGAIALFGNLIPVNENATLALDVLYIEKNGYRFKVTESIVTNEEKTSYNIATYVDDRKLSELGWASVEVATDETKNYTNQYLQALRESKTRQEVVYTTADSGSNTYVTPTTVTNTQKPDPLDYLITAGINIGASVIKTFADIFKKDLPYLYQIVPKSKIWIDLKIEENGEYVK